MTKIFYVLTILISTILIQQTYCQTVHLGMVNVSIGDSLSAIQSQIDTNFYSFTMGLQEDSFQSWHLYYKKDPPNEIASLYFFVPFVSPKGHLTQPILTSISKVWATNDNSSLTDAMIKFYDLLEVCGSDKYYLEKMFWRKSVEPEITSYYVNVPISYWHSIEFNFSKNSFQLSESISEESYRYDEYTYCVFFDNKKRYATQKSDIITEIFEHEKDAEKRLRELQLSYLSRGEELPSGQIIRIKKEREIPSK